MSSAVTNGVAIAANPWLAQPARIAAITQEVAGVATYHLRFVDPEVNAAYRFRAGQFNMIYLPGVGEVAIGVSTGGVSTGGIRTGGVAGPTPRTDAAAAEGPTWDHTVRVAGQVTTALSRLAVGGMLGLRGPYGSVWPLDEFVGKDVLLVAGGTGLASLRSAIYELLNNRDRYASVRLLYGARSPDTLLYASEYPAWIDAGMEIQTTVDRAAAGWTGPVGVVPQLQSRLRPWAPERTAMICCGPEVMIRFAVRAALARGLNDRQIWVSMERNMQCAVGLCGHCQLGPQMICKTGPVVRLDAIEPYLAVEGL